MWRSSGSGQRQPVYARPSSIHLIGPGPGYCGGCTSAAQKLDQYARSQLSPEKKILCKNSEISVLKASRLSLEDIRLILLIHSVKALNEVEYCNIAMFDLRI